MANSVVKLKKCSDPNETIWITGEPGDWTTGTYSISVIGKVVKLANYGGPIAAFTPNFAPSEANPKLGIGNSSYALNAEDCWQVVQIEDSGKYDEQTDPDGPWIADGGIVVNGFTQLAGYNTCTGCLGETTTDCETTETTADCGCGAGTSTGCTNKNCDCQNNDPCLVAPPDCGDECDDCACVEVTPSQCVTYNGPKIECLGINPGMSMNQVIALIGSNICDTDINTSCSDLECSNNKAGCISPLDIIFKPFFDSLAESDLTDPDNVGGFIQKYFEGIWSNGIIRSNDCDNPVCCQECCEDNFYFLGGAQLGFAFFELTQYPSCCANSSFSSSIATAGAEFQNENISSVFDSLVGIATKGSGIEGSTITIIGSPNPLIFGNTKQCCTDGTFQSCLDDLYDSIDQDTSLVAAGLVESQYANNDSLVCDLVNYLNDTSISTLTTAQKVQIAKYFIERGLIVSCCNSQIFIGGVEVYYTLIVNGTISNCVQDKIIPTFDIGPYCLGSTPTLPSAVSIEGITGSWVETVVDTSTVGTSQLTFVPDAGQNAYTVLVDYQVVEIVPNDLNLIACEDSEGAGIATIDLTAQNTAVYPGGVLFTWFADATLTILVTDPTAAVVNMDGGEQTFYCLVEDANGCQGTGSITYRPEEVPVFDFTEIGGESYCALVFEVGNEDNPVPALPAPTNAVPGSWSPAVIDVSTAGSFEYTYTPSSGCDPVTVTIIVLNPGDPSPC